MVGQTRRKLNKLHDFLRVFFIFDAIPGGWGGGRGRRLLDKGRLLERGVLYKLYTSTGASIRYGAFI